jgi:hypothetical protein
VKGIATPELYRDELRIVTENPYGKALADVFLLSNIDYGRADYGFLKGRPQIFEINTNPTVKFVSTHPVAERRESARIFQQNYLNALEAIDTPATRRLHFKVPQLGKSSALAAPEE